MLMLRSYFLSTNMLWTSKIKTKVVGLDPQKQIWKQYWFTATYSVLTDQHLAQLSSQLEVYLRHSCLASWRCTSPDWTTVLCSVCKTLGNKRLAMILCPPSKCYNLPRTRLFRSTALSGNPRPQSSRLAVPLLIGPWPGTVNLVPASWCPLLLFKEEKNVHTENESSDFPTATWPPVLPLGKNSSSWAPPMKELPARRTPLGYDQKF